MGYTLNKFITGLTHRDKKSTHIYTNILFIVTNEPHLLVFDSWIKPENTGKKPAQVKYSQLNTQQKNRAALMETSEVVPQICTRKNLPK